ncbi:MAG: response regulator [Magnetococcus sp. WYHC-3]
MIGTILRRFQPTIGIQIFLGFGLVLTVLAGQALVGWLGFDRVVTLFSQYGRTNHEVRTILELERNVLDLQRGVLAFTYSGYAGVALRVRELQQVLTQQLEQVSGQVKDPARADVLRRIREHFRQYTDSFQVAVEERQLQDRLVAERMTPSGDEAVRLLEEIRTTARASGDTAVADLAGAASDRLLLAQRDALRFLLKPQSGLVRSADADLDAMSDLIVRLITRLEDPRLRAHAERVRDLTPQFHAGFIAMVQATRAYMHLVYVVMGGEAAEIAWLARELKTLTLREQEQVESGMNASVARNKQLTGQAALLAIILGLLLAWGISRAIAEPLRAMTHSLTALARGRMDAEIPGKGRRDELGALAMAADIFKEKAHELDNASRYKSEFLANMSHELRTPLNSLLILSRLLANNETGNLDANQQESARIIHDSGSDLLRLINDILDLSKIEAGRMDLYAETRGFTVLTHALERLFRPVAEKKGLAFSIRLADDLPEELLTDWGKVEQILRNFLSNAFKFTDQGMVTVAVARPGWGHVFMNHELSAGTMVGISVMDSGIGIPEDKRQQIFEAFRQADGSTSRRYGGTGLGLSISRRFADMLGGEIQVSSTLGQGSCFTLYLPLQPRFGQEPGDSRHGGTLPADAPQGDFRDMTRTLLVVDDDTRNLFAIKQVLEGRVGRLLAAHNGRQALELLDEHPDIDLVLMDIMMPEMNGYEAMQAIRAQPRFARLPMVALTAKTMPGDREKCLEAGASDYLAKPVQTPLLFHVLDQWLAPPRLPGEQNAVVKAPSDASVWPKWRILANGDPVAEIQRLQSLTLASFPVNVLIVDDDMRNAYSLAQALQPKTSRVLLARDGSKALELLAREPDVNLMLLDLMMPNMDGMSTLQALRRESAFQDLPVIMLSACSLAEDRERCLAAGADDYLTKPVELEILMKKMQQCLANSRHSLPNPPHPVATEARCPGEAEC